MSRYRFVTVFYLVERSLPEHALCLLMHLLVFVPYRQVLVPKIKVYCPGTRLVEVNIIAVDWHECNVRKSCRTLSNFNIKIIDKRSSDKRY
jgi:hypothetical protein